MQLYFLRGRIKPYLKILMTMDYIVYSKKTSHNLVLS